MCNRLGVRGLRKAGETGRARNAVGCLGLEVTMDFQIDIKFGGRIMPDHISSSRSSVL